MAVWRCLYLMHIAVHLLWIYLHVWLVERLVWRVFSGAATLTRRKIVFVGDDFTVGVGRLGSTLGQRPGAHARLEYKIQATLSRRPFTSPVVWACFAEGSLHARSEHWLPGGKAFESVFDPDVGVHPRRRHRLHHPGSV